ncbi:unnamed protein product [Caenorhabditis sp. 36 PRJEB53466]|nr:unnamed protein product [Caenorhabditis sp. 36 PRJEB53466]
MSSSEDTFEAETEESAEETRHAALNRLEPERDPEDTDEESSDEGSEEPTFEVEEIIAVACTDNGKGLKFETRWVSDQSTTWEPLSSFHNGLNHEEIQRFRRKNPAKFDAEIAKLNLKKRKSKVHRHWLYAPLDGDEERHEKPDTNAKSREVKSLADPNRLQDPDEAFLKTYTPGIRSSRSKTRELKSVLNASTTVPIPKPSPKKEKEKKKRAPGGGRKRKQPEEAPLASTAPSGSSTPVPLPLTQPKRSSSPVKPVKNMNTTKPKQRERQLNSSDEEIDETNMYDSDEEVPAPPPKKAATSARKTRKPTDSSTFSQTTSTNLLKRKATGRSPSRSLTPPRRAETSAPPRGSEENNSEKAYEHADGWQVVNSKEMRLRFERMADEAGLGLTHATEVERSKRLREERLLNIDVGKTVAELLTSWIDPSHDQLENAADHILLLKTRWEELIENKGDRRDFHEVFEAITEETGNFPLHALIRIDANKAHSLGEDYDKPRLDKVISLLTQLLTTVVPHNVLAAQDNYDFTLLHHAIERKQLELSLSLIQAGSPLHLFNKTHRVSPLEMVIFTDSTHKSDPVKNREVLIPIFEAILRAGGSCHYMVEGPPYHKELGFVWDNRHHRSQLQKSPNKDAIINAAKEFYFRSLSVQFRGAMNERVPRLHDVKDAGPIVTFPRGLIYDTGHIQDNWFLYSEPYNQRTEADRFWLVVIPMCYKDEKLVAGLESPRNTVVYVGKTKCPRLEYGGRNTIFFDATRAVKNHFIAVDRALESLPAGQRLASRIRPDHSVFNIHIEIDPSEREAVFIACRLVRYVNAEEMQPREKSPPMPSFRTLSPTSYPSARNSHPGPSRT